MVYAGSPGCVGDCNDDGVVTVDEIVLLVNIVLGISPISSCPTLTQPPDVADVVVAINAALTGCTEMSTPTSTSIPNPTPTPYVVTFELGAGSLIYSPGAVPIEEPLSGGFTISGGMFVPQFRLFDIDALHFESKQFSIDLAEQDGDVRVGTDCPDLAFISAKLHINGVPFEGFGIANVGGCPADVSMIEPFELCVSTEETSACDEIRAGTRVGYVLTIIPVNL